MSTYVLMRILESAPRRYELGIRLLTLGRLEKAYDRLASHIEPGQRVLDVGCGTGALTLRAARRGAQVKGIDINPEMLAIAAQRVQKEERSATVRLVEMGVAELDAEDAASYDAVMSGLCFSELSDDERRYTLKHVVRILRPGGLLLVADEARPRNLFLRAAHALIRAPLVALTYAITQQTTQPVAGLPEQMIQAGLSIVSMKSDALQSLLELVARKPAGDRP